MAPHREWSVSGSNLIAGLILPEFLYLFREYGHQIAAYLPVANGADGGGQRIMNPKYQAKPAGVAECPQG